MPGAEIFNQLPHGSLYPWSTSPRSRLEVSWIDATTVRITPTGAASTARIPFQNAAGTIYYTADLTAAVDIDFTSVGAGGIDAGAIAAGQTWDIYLIAATGTVPGTMVGLATLGGGAPALPAGYGFVSGPLRTAYTTDTSASLSEWAVPLSGIQPAPAGHPFGTYPFITLVSNTETELYRYDQSLAEGMFNAGHSQFRLTFLGVPGNLVTQVQTRLSDGQGGNIQSWLHSGITSDGSAASRQRWATPWTSLKGTAVGLFRASGSENRDCMISIRARQTLPTPGANNGAVYPTVVEFR